MSITRKFATAVGGAIAGLAGLTIALIPADGPEDSPTTDPRPATEIADSPDGDAITSDFPWN